MKLSIIIPTLNEQAVLGGILKRLNNQLQQAQVQAEIIVSDGGSSDQTLEIAHTHGAKIVRSVAGRAKQMNEAVGRALGEWLWFLHADCDLPPGLISIFCSNLTSKTLWGYFPARIRNPGLPYRIIETGINWRSRMFALPYGDQGMFVSASLFDSVGRYDETPIMEDVLLARKLSRHARPTRVPCSLLIHPRRWQRFGILRTLRTNWQILFSYGLLGTDPMQLAALYQSSGPNPDVSSG